MNFTAGTVLTAVRISQPLRQAAGKSGNADISVKIYMQDFLIFIFILLLRLPLILLKGAWNI